MNGVKKRKAKRKTDKRQWVLWWSLKGKLHTFFCLLFHASTFSEFENSWNESDGIVSEELANTLFRAGNLFRWSLRDAWLLMYFLNYFVHYLNSYMRQHWQLLPHLVLFNELILMRFLSNNTRLCHQEIF